MMNCQQDQLYAAESSCRRGQEFHSVEEMQRWVDQLRDRPWWTMFYAKVLRVEVGAARSNGRGSVGDWFPELSAGRIEMHPAHWCVRVILHELAHVLAAARFGSKSHDPYFARVYLELVYHEMGPGAYTELWESFQADGIRHDPGHDHTLLQGRPMPPAE